MEPWRDDISRTRAARAAADAGEVRARREIPEIGVTVLTLSNGVEVWLKPTDFRNDQINFTANSRGGTSLAPEAEYLDASFSASLVGIAGVGGFSPVDLDKVLAGRIANASAYVSTYTHGNSGGSTPRDLETALQLVYLHFTASNQDPEAFALLKRRLDANLANQAQSPGAAFGEEVRRINTSDHYSVRPMRPDDVSKTRRGADDGLLQGPVPQRRRLHVLLRRRFHGGADDAAADDISRRRCRRPGRPRRSFGIWICGFRQWWRRETVNKGQEPRSQTAITFFSDTGLDELESHRLRAATTVLQMRLRDVLREELGGTYSVSVG